MIEEVPGPAEAPQTLREWLESCVKSADEQIEQRTAELHRMVGERAAWREAIKKLSETEGASGSPTPNA